MVHPGRLRQYACSTVWSPLKAHVLRFYVMSKTAVVVETTVADGWILDAGSAGVVAMPAPKSRHTRMKAVASE